MYQNELRQKHLNTTKTLKLDKVDSAITKLSRIQSNNDECVKQLYILMDKEEYKEEYLVDATMDHFA